MAQYRMQVSYESTAEPDASNYVTNTFYLDTDALSGADDPEALAEDTAALFTSYRTVPGNFDTCRVRAYDMSDPKPRLPVAEVTAPNSTSAASGPREVALCLSYFAGRNLPRTRGRLFIGPWSAGVMAERPSAALQTTLTTLAEGLSGLGGVNVQWVHYSPTTQQFTNVTDYWIDDEWDTVRSRGLSPSGRVTGTVSG